MHGAHLFFSGHYCLCCLHAWLDGGNRTHTEYCRKKGLYVEQIQRWRQECINGVGHKSSDTDARRNARNENIRLKRKIERKDKALAESAALLVLSKKFQALWEDEDQ